MIMQQVTLVNSDRFELISFGNGSSYLLTNVQTRQEFHVQDDDATAFRDEWEEHENMFPLKSTDAVMAWLWNMYEVIAVPLD
jgi:hypothetical protein